MVKYRVVPRKVIPAGYIDDLKKKIDNLRRIVLQKNEEIENLKRRLDTLGSKRTQVLREKVENERIGAENERIRAELEKERDEVGRIKNEHEDLTSQLQSLQKQFGEKEESERDFRKRIDDHERKIKSYDEEALRFRNEAEDYERKIKSYDEETLRFRNDIATKETTINGLNQQISDLNAKISELNETIGGKEEMIRDYEERTKEFGRYLLEIRDVKLDEKKFMTIARSFFSVTLILGVVGTVFAVFANELVFWGIENFLRIKIAVSFLGVALPLAMIGITFRLFASRASVFYLNFIGALTGGLALLLFNLYYPFLYPLAGAVGLLYILAIGHLFVSILFSLPKIHGKEDKKEVEEVTQKEEPEEEKPMEKTEELEKEINRLFKGFDIEKQETKEKPMDDEDLGT